jgi:hypothetical protein
MASWFQNTSAPLRELLLFTVQKVRIFPPFIRNFGSLDSNPHIFAEVSPGDPDPKHRVALV